MKNNYQVSFAAYEMIEHRLFFSDRKWKMKTDNDENGAQHTHFLTEEALFIEQVDYSVLGAMQDWMEVGMPDMALRPCFHREPYKSRPSY
jgi:hypothetical protein